MCSGDYIIYSCCGFAEYARLRSCSIVGPYYPLQHRILGRTIRRTRPCRSCTLQRIAEELHQASEHCRWQERAKALMEYWQGRRPWPRTDEEIRNQCNDSYLDEQRLHPWVNFGTPGIDVGFHWDVARDTFEETYRNAHGSLAGQGARLFQEMLDRQSDIDRTGRAITEDDRRYEYRRLLYFPVERERDEDIHQSIAPEENINNASEEIGLSGDVLLSFIEWYDVNGEGSPTQPQEVSLRRMVHDYLQYLRGFTTDGPQRAIRFFEVIGNAVLQADGLHYDYIPLPRGPDVHSPMTFRQWIVVHPSPLFQGTQVDSFFLNALERYSSYLETEGFLADREVFLHDRSQRVLMSIEFLADMPDPEAISETIELYAHEFDESYSDVTSDSCARLINVMRRDITDLVIQGVEQIIREEEGEEERSNWSQDSIEGPHYVPPIWDADRAMQILRDVLATYSQITSGDDASSTTESGSDRIPISGTAPLNTIDSDLESDSDDGSSSNIGGSSERGENEDGLHENDETLPIITSLGLASSHQQGFDNPDLDYHRPLQNLFTGVSLFGTAARTDLNDHSGDDGQVSPRHGSHQYLSLPYEGDADSENVAEVVERVRDLIGRLRHRMYQGDPDSDIQMMTTS